MAEAQTRAIYALIRDGKLSDAIGVLQGVLQVRTQRNLRTLAGTHANAPASLCLLQMSPGSRAALSLLAHCFYHQEEYEAAARTCVRHTCNNAPPLPPHRHIMSTAALVCCRYAGLAHRYRDVPQYQLYWAQSLCKAGLFNEAIRAAAAIEGFPQARRGRTLACG